ncbi:MAG TPA: SRPBCC family protein [Actinomycetota bacterium]|nr:SRPBCC family protein [Actinomycetota bacterium]
MTTDTRTAVTTQVYRVYIKASPQAVWDAITKPEWNERFGYPGRLEYDLRPGGTFRAIAGPKEQAMGMPEALADGEILEADPPRRLVQTWRFLYDPELAGEEATRLTWDIEEDDGGVTRLTLTHELENAPKTAAAVASVAQIYEGGGGWALILSDLKTLLETGKPFGEE